MGVAAGRRRALFVDRDGTLIPDLHYLKDADRLELFRGVAGALARAREHAWTIVCVTNQSGIERGFYSVEDVERIHARLNERLRTLGASIDAFYYCPHAPERGCTCRKPGPRLFEEARDALGLDLDASVIVGDRVLDAQAGERLGMMTALVRWPHHAPAVSAEFARAHVVPTVVSDSFAGAVARVLARG